MSSKRNSKKNNIISEVSDEFTNAFTESLSGSRQRKQCLQDEKVPSIGASLSFSRKRKNKQPNKVKLSMKKTLGSNKFISGRNLKQAQSQLKLVDTAADKHCLSTAKKQKKYTTKLNKYRFIKEDPYGLIGVNENLLATTLPARPASNIYNDDVALYSLKRLVQHRSWKTCYIRKSRKIHFKTGKKRTGVRRTCYGNVE